MFFQSQVHKTDSVILYKYRTQVFGNRECVWIRAHLLLSCEAADTVMRNLRLPYDQFTDSLLWIQ